MYFVREAAPNSSTSVPSGYQSSGPPCNKSGYCQDYWCSFRNNDVLVKGSGWQQGGGPQSNFNPPPQPPYQQQYNNFQGPAPPKPNWNEPNYYQEPHPPYQQNYQDNYYSGPPQQDPNFYQGPGMPPYQQQQQMNNWNQNQQGPGYYSDGHHQQGPSNMVMGQQQPMEYSQGMPPPPHPPPSNMPQHGNMMGGPPPPGLNNPQMHPPRFPRPPNMRFQRPHFQGMKRGGIRGRRPGVIMDGVGGGVMKHDIRMKKMMVRNLHQVQTVDTIPAPVPQATQNNQPPEEEDEEMKEYRKKIEEQKRLREAILRKKEEKRAEAIIQKRQLIQTSPGGAVQSSSDTGSSDGSPGEMRSVRVRTKDGRTIIRRLPLSMIQKMRKIPPSEAAANANVTATENPLVNGNVPNLPKAPPEPETRVVKIENLSATTTKTQILNMAKQVGIVQSISMESDFGRATVHFEKPTSAPSFLRKFQRKMVDLSMITISLVPE